MTVSWNPLCYYFRSQLLKYYYEYQQYRTENRGHKIWLFSDTFQSIECGIQMAENTAMGYYIFLKIKSTYGVISKNFSAKV